MLISNQIIGQKKVLSRNSIFLSQTPQQLVKTTVWFVLLDHVDTFTEQIPHGATLIPFAVQSPFTARRNKSVADQGFEDVEPSGILAARWESGFPEAVEIENVPQMDSQPAGAPLPWPMEFQAAQLDLDDFTVKFRRLSISRKQRHLPALFVSVLKDLDSLTPRCSLAIIYLTEIKNMALDDLIVNRPMVFNDTPGAMFFAVFEAAFFTKKHAPNVARKRQ